MSASTPVKYGVKFHSYLIRVFKPEEVLIIVDLQKKSDLEKEVNNLTKEIDILIAKAQARKADDDAIRAKIEEFTRRIVFSSNDVANVGIKQCTDQGIQ